MVRDMKWHIYNMNNEPLCWDDKALDFDTEQDARRFIDSVNNEINDEDFSEDNFVIIEDILYYDGGYLNASGFIVEVDDEGEAYLYRLN